MPPKPADTGDEKAPDNTINWIEFRDTMLASQTSLRNSINELIQALLHNRVHDNPRPIAAAANHQQDQQVNPMALQGQQVNPMALQGQQVNPMALQGHQVNPMALQEHQVNPLALQDQQPQDFALVRHHDRRQQEARHVDYRWETGVSLVLLVVEHTDKCGVTCSTRPERRTLISIHFVPSRFVSALTNQPSRPSFNHIIPSTSPVFTCSVFTHHPSLVHSEYAVLVQSIGGNDRLRVWSDIHCTVRLTGSVAKTLLVIYVNGEDMNVPSCLGDCTVEEQTIRRWSPELSREDETRT
ncbi:unnamed protein product [Arabis nemorensis]|uniref:Uncharacterized protein n=1 Tax=Arabis nemorensis TaxID=586526 RepID=A0A565BTM0_9BRAS|nr:unnamed protein product [Arabis nemorensis]